MEEVFVPNLQAAYRCFGLAAATTLFLLASMPFVLKRGPSRLRPLLQLGTGLLVLLGLGVSAFSLLDVLKSPTVVVNDRYLLLGNDTVAVEQVRRAYIEGMAAQRVMGPPRLDTVGVIEYGNDRSLLLAADRYDLRALIGSVQRVASR